MPTDSLPAAADAGHLTAALRQAGVLGDGCVREVTVKSSRDTIVSHIIRLGLSYDGSARDAPPSVILKIAHRDHAKTLWMAGRQEVAFYTEVAPLMPAGLIPRCFGRPRGGCARRTGTSLPPYTICARIHPCWTTSPSTRNRRPRRH